MIETQAQNLSCKLTKWFAKLFVSSFPWLVHVQVPVSNCKDLYSSVQLILLFSKWTNTCFVANFSCTTCFWKETLAFGKKHVAIFSPAQCPPLLSRENALETGYKKSLAKQSLSGQITIFHQPRFAWNSRGPIFLTFHQQLVILVVFSVAKPQNFHHFPRWMIGWNIISYQQRKYGPWACLGRIPSPHPIHELLS